jgi:hypothetical protein
MLPGFWRSPSKIVSLVKNGTIAYSLNRRDSGTAAGGNHEVFPV